MNCKMFQNVLDMFILRQVCFQTLSYIDRMQEF